MIDENRYFAAVDEAVEALSFMPGEPDSNDFGNFYWSLISSAYMELIRPVVSHLPRKGAQCVGEALYDWDRGRIKREEDILPRAAGRYAKWFGGEFMGLWRKAALNCRAMLSRGLEGQLCSGLKLRGLPGVRLDIFSLSGVLVPLENELRNKALPFMLREINSYELPELEDAAPDRGALLRQAGEALKLERDFRVGLERRTLNETLVTEELIFAFASEVYEELRRALAEHKRRCLSPGN